MKPLENIEQFICSPCAAPLLQAAGITPPMTMWCHTGTCALCGQTALISKARKYGLQTPTKPEPWQAT